MNAHPTPLAALVKLTLVALIWGGTFIAARIATAAMPAETAALWRYVVACVAVVAAAYALEGGLPRLSPRQWFGVTLLGATGVLAYNLCFMFGLKTVHAGRASLIIALNPAMVMLGSAAFFGERVDGRRAFGVALALGGAATVIGHGDPLALLRGDVGRGEILIFGCALSWAAFTLIARRIMRGLTPLAMTAYASLVGTAMLALTIPLAGADLLPPATLEIWLALGFLGVFGTAVAFVWFNDGVRVLGPSRASVFINLVPVAAVGLGVLLLHEPVDASVLGGGALVIAGVWFLNRVPRPQPAVAPA